MHVTLIDTPRFTFPLNHASNVAIPPLGVAYIAAAIESSGYELKVIDSIGRGLTTYREYGSIYVRGLSPDDILSSIPSSTDAIAISNMFSCQWLITRDLIESIRRKFPHAPLIIGGEHPTGMPEFTLRNSPVDFVVLGEGEETIVSLLGCLDNSTDQSIANVSGLAYRENSVIKVNDRRDRIKDIDSIQRPAWHHFNIEGYIGLGQSHGAALGRYMPMLATRGCPYKCTFCTSPEMWTRSWVMRDPKLIVDEIEQYLDIYGVTDFHFEDLTAIVRKDKILRLAEEILDRKLAITYQLPSGTRSEAIDRETARMIKASGCAEFQFAPESGDDRVRKSIEKKVDLGKMFQAATYAIDEGINVSCNFIFGFPEDDWRSIGNNFLAIIKCARLRFSGVNLNAYSPQPNTQSFRDLIASGAIKNFDDNYFMSLFTFQSFFVKKTSYNEKFSSAQITMFIFMGFVLFYTSSFLLRPTRILHAFKGIFRQGHVTKSETYARSMINELKRIREFKRNLNRSTL